MNGDDRKSVNNLHAAGSGSASGRPPASLRDASGASQSDRSTASNGRWSNGPPRQIPQPGQRGSNPYNQMTQNNFSTPRSYGNHTAKQTVFPHGSSSIERRPTKRLKKDPSSHSAPRAVTNLAMSINDRGTRAPRDNWKQPLASGSKPRENTIIDDIVVVDDSDEDLGQYISRHIPLTSSPDPMMIIAAVEDAVYAHPSEFGDYEDQQRRHLPKDSRTVEKMRRKHLQRSLTPPKDLSASDLPSATGSILPSVISIDVEDIENFSDYDVEIVHSLRKKEPPQNNVRQLTEHFESKSVHQVEQPVRRVNLLEINRKAVASNMKPKSSKEIKIATVVQEPKTLRTVAPSLSNLKFKKNVAEASNQGFNDNDASLAPTHSSKKPSAEHRLPLAAWSIGAEVFKAEHGDQLKLLCWDSNSSKVILRSGPRLTGPLHQVDEFSLNGLDITVTNAPIMDKHPIIMFTYPKSYKPEVTTSIDQRQNLKPGSQVLGMVVFKCLRDTSDDQRNYDGWSDSNYQQLVTFLRQYKSSSRSHNNFETIDFAAARSIWDGRERTDEFKRHSDARKTGDDEESIVPRPAPLSASAGGSAPRPRPRKRARSVTMPPDETPRRSSRQTSCFKSESRDPEELILVYPPSGNGAINITQRDLSKLEDGEYLNDTLIEFGLKLMMDKIRRKNPELADQIHVFSSFFYKKLRGHKTVEEGFQSVRKWTQKVDLFQKKFLIVPINEHLHWYLAIIYRPECILEPPIYTAVPSSVSTRARTTLIDKEDRSSTSASEVTVPTLGENVSSSLPRPTSPPFVEEPLEVEGMFQSNCSISTVGGDSMDVDPDTRTNSSDEGTGTHPQVGIVEDDDAELQYPATPKSESPEPNHMDVDMSLTDVQSHTQRPAIDEHISNGNDSEDMHAVANGSGVDTDGSTSGKTDHKRIGTSTLLDLEGRPDTDIDDLTVEARNFYGLNANKVDGKAIVKDHHLELVISSDTELDELDEVDNSLADVNNEGLTEERARTGTFIFTLDSLGTRHPAVLKSLTTYLKLEAKDKKNLGETSDTKGAQALVPVQPNFYDCGLYLLHFAREFVERGDHHCRVILSKKKKSNAADRNIEWNLVSLLDRHTLKAEIVELSEAWKKERAAKQAHTTDTPVSSDSEVDIVEDTTQTEKASLSRKGKAARLRG